MAWGKAAGNGIGGNDSTTGGSWNMGSFLTASAGEVVILTIASDNLSGTGATNDHLSLSDGGTGSWVKVYEYTYGPSGANSGATVSVWYLRVPPGGTVNPTINLSASGAKKAAVYERFTTTDTAAVVAVVGAPYAPQGSFEPARDPSGMAISGAPLREYLGIRGIAAESNSTTALTPSAGWTAPNSANGTSSGGGSAANIAARMEWDIATASDWSSDPTLYAADGATLLALLTETPSGPPGAALAGAIAGSATVSATGMTTLPAALAGSIAASSTVAGALTVTAGLAGSIAASSTVTGALTKPAAALAGAIAASSTVTATGMTTAPAVLAGSIAASSTVTAALAIAAGLAGIIDTAAATVTGSLTTPAGLAGAIAGHATITGGLAGTGAGAPLTGAIAASSTVTGALTKPAAALAGAPAGHATVTAVLTKPAAALAGASSGTATITATLTPAGALLGGIAAGSATLTGALVSSAIAAVTVDLRLDTGPSGADLALVPVAAVDVSIAGLGLLDVTLAAVSAVDVKLAWS